MLRIITTQMSVLNNIAKISVDTEIIEAHDKKSYNTTVVTYQRTSRKRQNPKPALNKRKTQRPERTFIFVVSKKERIKVFGIMIHY